VDTAIERLSVALAQELWPRERARREDSPSGRAVSIDRSETAAPSVRAARRRSEAAPQAASGARESWQSA
jgi:hypothetical protein